MNLCVNLFGHARRAVFVHGDIFRDGTEVKESKRRGADVGWLHKRNPRRLPSGLPRSYGYSDRLRPVAKRCPRSQTTPGDRGQRPIRTG